MTVSSGLGTLEIRLPRQARCWSESLSDPLAGIRAAARRPPSTSKRNDPELLQTNLLTRINASCTKRRRNEEGVPTRPGLLQHPAPRRGGCRRRAGGKQTGKNVLRATQYSFRFSAPLMCRSRIANVQAMYRQCAAHLPIMCPRPICRLFTIPNSGRCLPSSDRCCPEDGQFRRALGQLRPESIEVGTNRVNFGRIDKLGQGGPDLGRNPPTAAKANFSKIWPES